MDGTRFDNLARSLSHRLPRRTALRGFIGAASAGITTRLVIQDAAACLEDGQFCTHDDECCGVCISFSCTECVPKGNHGCVDDNDCCGGKQECDNGVCKNRKKNGNGNHANCNKKKKRHGKC